MLRQVAESNFRPTGVLGPDTTQEAIVVSRLLSSLPPPQSLLQVTGSATGATLADRALYSNLFRVIPPDSTQIMVSESSSLVSSPENLLSGATVETY